MPEYKNNTASIVTDPSGLVFKPGETRKPDFYLTSPSLTLVSHEPRTYPWNTLYDGTIAAAGNIGDLGQYAEVNIQNLTGDVLTVTPNEDGASPYKIPDSMLYNFKVKGRLGSITVSGSGTNNFQVYGVKEAT